MPTPRKDEKKADFISRCMGNDEAKSDFPDQDQRLAFCHSVWEDSRNMRTVMLEAVQTDAQPRTEELMGREFLVIDAVLVQGQVLNNNLGPTLLPPQDITDEWAQEWNGAPVIVHDHPTSRGVNVSARTPEILDSRGVGMVFRAEVDKDAGGTARLKGEVWLEIARAEQVAELAGILNRLRTGGKVELSTGFPVLAVDGIGTFNGENYEKIMHPKGVDHLAIFADKVGACSVEDGCGLGVHTEQEESVDVNSKEERGLMLRLLAHLLPKLSASNAEDSAPAAPGATPCEQVKTGTEFRLLIRRLKAQGLNNTEIGAACGRCPTTIGQVERGLILHPAEDALEKLREYARQKFLSAQAEGDRSDEEKRKLLDEALESAYGGNNKFLWIDATYAEEKRVVFGLVKDTPSGANEQLFEVTYQLAADSQEITFADEPKEVKRRVIYEPVANAAANLEVLMKPEDKAAADKAAENKAAEDKAAEDKAAEDKAAKDKAAENKAAEDKAAEDKAAEDKAAKDKAAAGGDAQNTEVAELQATVKAQAEAIDELKKITAPVVAENERERGALVKELAENKAVPFDEAELQAKPVEELRKLSAMSRGENYAGRGGPRVAENVAADGDQQFAPTVPYFEKDKDKKEGKE